MPTLPNNLPEGGWGVLTAFIFVAGWVITTLSSRGKHRQAEKAQTVEEAVRASVNLGPAVATLAAEVESLKKQLAEILPIKNVKYPAALNTVHRFREAHPDSPVEVAPEIVDDLKTL